MVMLPYDLSLIEGQRHAQPIENPPPEPAVDPPAEPEAQPRPDTQAAVQATSRRRRRLLRGLRLAGAALAQPPSSLASYPRCRCSPFRIYPFWQAPSIPRKPFPRLGPGNVIPCPRSLSE